MCSEAGPIFYDFFEKKTPFAAEKIESGSHAHPPYFNTCEQIEREKGREGEGTQAGIAPSQAAATGSAAAGAGSAAASAGAAASER